MTAGEVLYKAYFEKNGYTVEKRDINNTQKNADFALYRGSSLIAYCEVKDIDKLDQSYFQKVDLEKSEESSKIGSKKIPSQYGILLDKLHKAFPQLQASNPDHQVPSILAFYCDRIGFDANDMLDALNGYVIYDGNLKVYRKYGNALDRRTEPEKRLIDIYIFYKRSDNLEQRGYYYLYNTARFSKETLSAVVSDSSVPYFPNETIC